MAALAPVPLRVTVLDRTENRELIARQWAVWFRDLAARVDLNTPAGTFATNAAAIAGGLAVGQTYQTATGELRVVV